MEFFKKNNMDCNICGLNCASEITKMEELLQEYHRKQNTTSERQLDTTANISSKWRFFVPIPPFSVNPHSSVRQPRKLSCLRSCVPCLQTEIRNLHIILISKLSIHSHFPCTFFACYLFFPTRFFTSLV